MTVDQIKTMLSERPFRPFVIHTSDGQAVTVKAPDFAWVHPFGQTMYVCPDPDVDAHVIIDLLHVTKLVSPARNGGRRRRK